jgi:hypothetical protein
MADPDAPTNEQLPTDNSPTPTDPDDRRTLAKRGPIAEYMLDNIAIMALNGASTEEINKATGVAKRTVTKLLAGGANAKFDALYEGYRKRVLGMTVQHQMRLASLLDKSYAAIARALEAQDDRIAADAAFKLMDRAVPKNEKASNEFNVNVGFQNNLNLQTQTNTAFNKMGEELKSLISSLSTNDPEKHLKKGDEALPSSFLRNKPPTEETLTVDFTAEESGDQS